MGVFIVGMGNFIGYGNNGKKFRDCPSFKGLDKGSGKDQSSCSNMDGPKKNHFYVVRSRGEQKSSPNVVTGILQIFSIDVYDLLDPGDILSFVTPIIDCKFYIFPDVLNQPFLVMTPIGYSVIAKIFL